MIGRLRGVVDGRGENWALIDVGGVGYMIEGSTRLLDNLPPDGEAVSLAIETYVREDQLRLFAFANEAERSWFRLLMGVQGVGTRVALAIQGILSPDELSVAIANDDKTAITQAVGVGAKVAQRIVQELKNKVPEASFAVSTSATANSGQRQNTADAMSALTNLGYQRSQAISALAAANKMLGADATTQALIRQALKEIG